MTDNSYLRFVERPPAEGRKTKTVSVIATRDSALLGEIKWFGRWRQYAFFPYHDTIFNPDCLDSINAEIRRLMDERREARAVLIEVVPEYADLAVSRIQAAEAIMKSAGEI